MKKKILIADDDETLTELLACAFGNAGWDPVTCTTGSNVLEAIKRDPPGIIVLDLVMPGLDGYTLLIKMDGNPQTRNIPVIVISALPAARGLFDKFQQVKLFLDKPFDPNVIVEKAGELCGGS